MSCFLILYVIIKYIVILGKGGRNYVGVEDFVVRVCVYNFGYLVVNLREGLCIWGRYWRFRFYCVIIK